MQTPSAWPLHDYSRFTGQGPDPGVRVFAQWEEKRPGFVKIDRVVHCGDHLDRRFLHTLALTDLATGWTECTPLLEKSARAVLAALEQARTLFPFPSLGIDTPVRDTSA